MFGFPLHAARCSLKRTSPLLVRAVTRNSTSGGTIRVSPIVNNPQAAQAIAQKTEIIDKLCTRLAEARQTTQTEQLIWLAKQSLERSTAQKNKVAQDNTRMPDDESHPSSATGTPRTQPWEGLSIWSHLWYKARHCTRRYEVANILLRLGETFMNLHVAPTVIGNPPTFRNGTATLYRCGVV